MTPVLTGQPQTANSSPADSADTSQPRKKTVSRLAGQEQCQASI